MNDILELDSIYESLYEYYINDYIIFEGILRRDYMECIGVLNEDGNKNFLKNIINKIIELLSRITSKIKGIKNKILNKNNKINESSSKNISKCQEYINKLEDMKEISKKVNYDNFIVKNIYLPYNNGDLRYLKTRISEIRQNIVLTTNIHSMMKDGTKNDSHTYLKNFLKQSDKFYKKLHNQLWENPYSGKFPYKAPHEIINYFHSLDIMYKELLDTCDIKIKEYKKI